jgi:hypothetical protein
VRFKFSMSIMKLFSFSIEASSRQGPENEVATQVLAQATTLTGQMRELPDRTAATEPWPPSCATTAQAPYRCPARWPR